MFHKIRKKNEKYLSNYNSKKPSKKEKAKTILDF
jgi:hypothetical protein